MWPFQKGPIQINSCHERCTPPLQFLRGEVYRKIIGAEFLTGFLFSTHKLHFALGVSYLLDYKSTSLISPMEDPCVCPWRSSVLVLFNYFFSTLFCCSLLRCPSVSLPPGDSYFFHSYSSLNAVIIYSATFNFSSLWRYSDRQMCRWVCDRKVLVYMCDNFSCNNFRVFIRIHKFACLPQLFPRQRWLQYGCLLLQS